MVAKAAKQSDDQEVIDPDTGEVLVKESKDVTTTKGNAVAAVDDFDFGADAGSGFDNQTAEDVSVPFMTILQPGSPQVQGEDAAFKAGMWFNNTTNEATSGKAGLTFIPAYTEHKMVEWVPRDKGGGLVETHDIDSDLSKEVRAKQPLGKYKHPTNDNDLIETYYVYGVAINDDGIGSPAVLAFSSTMIKPYKDWSFRMRSIVITNPKTGQKITSKNMPMWAFCYRLTTVFVEKNGYKWFNFVPTFAGLDENKKPTAMASLVKPGSDIYMLAKSVYEGVSSGKQKADTGSLKQDDVADNAPKKANTSSEDAPY